jgi:hypothetical protein
MLVQYLQYLYSSVLIRKFIEIFFLPVVTYNLEIINKCLVREKGK